MLSDSFKVRLRLSFVRSNEKGTLKTQVDGILFFYDPDGGYVSAFKKDHGYEFYR